MRNNNLRVHVYRLGPTYFTRVYGSIRHTGSKTVGGSDYNRSVGVAVPARGWAVGRSSLTLGTETVGTLGEARGGRVAVGKKTKTSKKTRLSESTPHEELGPRKG